ncbi:MAG: hypothetical protein AB2L07_10770 [Thermoanaerobaculaceae bacterium]
MRCGKWMMLLLALVVVAATVQAEEFKLNIGGTTYTKWLWGNMRDDGSVYNFTTVPGEGYGDNGQGSEIELLLDAKVSRYVAVKARLHSRFNQNQWTNFGGFGGTNPPKDCTGGDCGEYDPRSNQYVKLRGVAVTFTPGYKWIDTATIGANDFGIFDPFVIGRIRYIDRDNASGLLFQGSMNRRAFTWDAVRISLPRLWAGPNYNTGNYTAADAAYGYQFKYTAGSAFDFGGIVQYVNDIEVDNRDTANWDNGRDYRTRFRNGVWGAKFGIHPSSVVDIRGAYYRSSVDSVPMGISNDAPGSFGMNGYSSVIAGKHKGESWKLNADFNDPFENGLSFNFELFSIGEDYVSMMAARRESDVLLTEGHDAAFAFPGPSNASYGIWGGNATRIGYGGWDGNAQQVATINVDNEFTDFDEPMAETAIGWKGITFTPTFASGALELAGEYTYLDYNTNWQAWGDPSRSITNTDYPATELDSGVGHNFRTAYQPFQDKTTHIALIKGKYVADVGKGLDIFFKVKAIQEKDYRMNDARFLPYLAGACPTTGTLGCAVDEQGNFIMKRYYSGSNTTADFFGNPPVITVNGVTGYKWKPFDSLSDDDRDLDYRTFQLGVGYQLTDDLYGSAAYELYQADLKDGNTALQAYQLHEMASGEHQKSKLVLKARYIIGGAEIGFEYQWNFGWFQPDFGDGFVVQYASADTAANVHVKVGSRGFSGRWGGWNSLEKREFTQQRLKAFMKVQF